LSLDFLVVVGLILLPVRPLSHRISPLLNMSHQSNLSSFFSARKAGTAPASASTTKRPASVERPKEKENAKPAANALVDTDDEDAVATAKIKKRTSSKLTGTAQETIAAETKRFKTVKDNHVVHDEENDPDLDLDVDERDTEDTEKELPSSTLVTTKFTKRTASKLTGKAQERIAVHSVEDAVSESAPKKEATRPIATQAPETEKAAPKSADVSNKKETTKKKAIEDDDEGDDEDADFQEAAATDEDLDDASEDLDDESRDNGDDDIDVDDKPKRRSVNTALRSKSTAKLTKGQLSATSAKSNETLLQSATWKTGSSIPYLALCTTFEAIEAITSRLAIQELLTDLFRQVLALSPKDMYELIYLASNSVAAAYECIELGIGDAILIKAIGEAYGTNPSMIKQQYQQEGDLGTVAKVSKGKQRTLGFGAKPKPLLAKEVLAVLREIANTTGTNSQKHKVDKIKKVLVRAQGPEAKYIIRALQGKLRIGLAQSTVLISLAHAVTLSPPSTVAESTFPLDKMPPEATEFANAKTGSPAQLEAAVQIIKKAYSEVPSYDAILDAALSVPLHHMHVACTLTPGIPVAPMLAKPTKSVQEVLKRLNGQRFTCEFKYDGERAQVHMLPDGTTRVFSRNLLDTSDKYPEVPLYVKEACQPNVTSFVLDTEVVAFNPVTGKLVPFQILSTRKKSEESAETAKVQVICQAFDLMYLNGESLLNKTLSERRDLMMSHFSAVEAKFQFAVSLDHTEDGDTTMLEEFLETAVKNQCEGLMVKTLDKDACYEPSRRSLNWLKLKKDYLEGLGDSVDLVPLGAYNGRGKRTGYYGAYLLGCYDADTEEFQSVCKIGTGFSDEDLKLLHESFQEHIIPSKHAQYNASDTLDCDVWFNPVQVWEVKAADLSKSSTHKGALGKVGEVGRGIGLRFPRFERLRPDKKPEQATSSEQILDMYYNQDSVANEGGGENDDDDGI
jgi:DNA ligase 1